MGDRANVYVKGYNGTPGVYLYTHWSGTELPEIVQSALARQERWDDNQYLARIVFCEMVKGHEDGETGFGIGASVGDGGDRIIILDPGTQEVTIGGRTLSFKEFITLARPTWDLGSADEEDDSPVREDQRRALFALFGEVFTDSEQDKRLAFTRMVLGKGADEPVSWSPRASGALTVAEAYRLLEALDGLNQ